MFELLLLALAAGGAATKKTIDHIDDEPTQDDGSWNNSPFYRMQEEAKEHQRQKNEARLDRWRKQGFKL